MLSQENKVSKFCMDAGFIHVVEIGQYFMTKDIGEQFFAKACREYTLPRSDESSQPKGWIQGKRIIGPVLEITTSCLYGKRGIEIRIWSVGQDNSQSWFYLGIHDRFIRAEKFRKNMFDTSCTGEMCRQMDELADEDHTHHLTPEEIRDYRVNWWIRSNKVGSDTMPVRHRSDFASIVNLATAVPRLGGTGKNRGGILLMSITTKTYPAPNDQGNLIEK